MSWRTKYPRTPHVPWSPGASAEDKTLPNMGCFIGKKIVITEKLDGENTTIYPDGYVHARSLTMSSHPSRSRVKALAAQLAGQLPYDWRICGENVTAVHSIEYDELDDFFYVFSIWDENNNCLSWEDTVEWCRMLHLSYVPYIYSTTWDYGVEVAMREGEFMRPGSEGYVVRNASSFPYSQYTDNVAKYVRDNHVQTDEHWLIQKVKYQKINESEEDR